ncbi:MAG TPA: class I SAM-dependent RNA methyltransferase [Bryobacteraceae bacterium]|nr:class I SAM-dependent RNA methyltransferase [Bryobacteraceae bacterium]
MTQPLKIEKLIYGGEGLSRVAGEVIFTPFVLPDETVEAERTGARKHAQRARAVAVTEPSPDRVAPLCPYFGHCGGCQYQHATYDAQVRLKRGILSETLRRVGKIEFAEERIETISGEPFGYRNRAQFHFERGKLGYREMNSRKLVPIEKCPISSPKINEAITKLTRMARDRRWPDFLHSLEIFTDERSVQWNVLEAEKPLAKSFFEWLSEEIPGTVPGPLEYLVNRDTFTVSGPAFFQVNRFLLPRLAELAIGDAAAETAWDLYAGVGLFSLPLARRFAHVTAVEGGRAAAADLRVNARSARLRIDVQQRQTETFLAEAKEAPDFVLADPPRSGLEKATVTRLLELRPETIALVACDPATLARDLLLLGAAYRIESIRMVDLFPQTFHIETMVGLKRLDRSA